MKIYTASLLIYRPEALTNLKTNPSNLLKDSSIKQRKQICVSCTMKLPTINQRNVNSESKTALYVRKMYLENKTHTYKNGFIASNKPTI